MPLRPFFGGTPLSPGAAVFVSSCPRSNNNLSKALLSSDLFMNNWIINPNTCNKPFAIVNGWSPNLTNVPDDAKNTWNSLQTIWAYPADIGDLTKVRLQILITGNNAIHVRMYENGKFENWS